MTRNSYIGLALAVFFCLYAVTVRVVRPRIERDLAERTRKALEHDGLPVKGTAFSGRDGEVRLGVSPEDRGVIEAARRTVGAVFGVRVARVTAEAAAGRAPSLRVDRIGENLNFSGVFPHQSAIDALMEGTREAFKGMHVTSELRVEDGITHPPYLSALAPFVGLLTQTAPEGIVELNGQELRLSGDVPDLEAQATLSARATALLPGGLALKLDLKPAILTPPPAVEVARHPAPEVPRRTPSKEIEAAKLLFQYDSAELTQEAAYQVEPLVEMLKEQGEVRLRIIGHADGKGPDGYNVRLSERRAQAVAKLFSENGITGKFKTEGHGKREPVADNETEIGRSLNRRVEFQILERVGD